mmetsp:Transcript_23237/g.52634  ORF Transcript_23237/g.52634 Transcript_23237/m.52634 type:complete len:437 (+) Transcript_23237:190-1500(+)
MFGMIMRVTTRSQPGSMFTCSGVEIEPRPFREPDPPYEESYLNRFQFDSGKPLFGGRDDGGSSCSTTAHSSCCEQSQLSGMGELDGDFGAGDTRGGIFVFDMNHLQEEPARTETIFGCDYDLPRLSHHEIDRRMQTETQELRDRAELMLQREQRQLRLSSKAAAVSASTVDAVCRSRMFEWALLVVSHSFPCQSGQISDPKGYTRQYSTEAIQIVTQAFALVDQIPCQIRNEYKLYCMVALHIVAKSSGLFSPSKERLTEQQCSDRSTIGSASSSPKRSTSGGDPSDMLACAVTPEDEAHRPSRPALDLLSLDGLVALCQSEFSAGELQSAESEMLRRLGWRANAVTALDWLDWTTSLLRLCLDSCGVRGDAGRGLLRRVGDEALLRIERRAGSRLEPSLVAIDSFFEAMRRCGEDDASLREAVAIFRGYAGAVTR